MFEKRNFCCIFIVLHIHGVVGIPHQSGQVDPYANIRSFPQLGHHQQQQPQQHLFESTQNFYVPNSHNTPQYSNYAVAAALHPYGYDASGTPNHQVLYQYPTPSRTHSQVWSSDPIVVADDDETSNNNYKSDLQTRPKSSKALPLTYNSNAAGQQQQLSSNYNYHNPAVYHSSDVWRQQQHLINTSPQSKEQNSLNYNRQQPQNQDDVQPPHTPYRPQQQQHYHNQQQQQQPDYQQQQHQQQQHRQHHQLYGSNTDLNYLQATPINHRTYSSARGVVGTDTTADYSEHFKEYLRKHPRRIKPIY